MSGVVRRVVFGFFGIGLFVGCPARVDPPIDAGVVDAGVDSGTPDAGPPTPRVLNPELLIVAIDGGVEELTTRDAGAGLEIEPAQELRLVLPAFGDARVRLFDWTDQVVATDDVAEFSDAGTLRYSIVPVTPLKPGRHYALQVDPQTSEQLVDAKGQPFEDYRLELLVRGEVQPEPGRPPKKKRKK